MRKSVSLAAAALVALITLLCGCGGSSTDATPTPSSSVTTKVVPKRGDVKTASMVTTEKASVDAIGAPNNPNLKSIPSGQTVQLVCFRWGASMAAILLDGTNKGSDDVRYVTTQGEQPVGFIHPYAIGGRQAVINALEPLGGQEGRDCDKSGIIKKVTS